MTLEAGEVGVDSGSTSISRAILEHAMINLRVVRRKIQVNRQWGNHCTCSVGLE